MTRAVIVGSGPNGLTAAVVLARAGLDVTVVEAADTIGGGTRSSELLRAGVVHDHCSAFHPLGAASPAFRELGLERYGLTWCHAEIDCAHPLDDSADGASAGLLYRSITRTAAGLGPDGRAWRDMFGGSKEAFDELADDVLGPMLRLPAHPIRLAEFGHRALYPGTGLARVFHGDRARSLFGGIAAHAFTRLDRPGSAAPGLMLLEAGHQYGWPAARGGSSAIATALASALIDAGGTIVTGTRIVEWGDIGDADVVMLDVMPAAAASILGDRLPGRVSRAFLKYEHGPSAFKVDYVIDGEVGWADPSVARAGTVHLGGTLEQIADAEAQAVDGRMPDRPFVLVGQQWVADPSRAAGSLKPLWAYAHVPHGYSGDAIAAITAQIERFAPGFRERIVDSVSTSPAQLERSNANYVGGDIGGGANDLRHLIARPRLTAHPYSTGVNGVYLCSSATPPGGGVHGMCGYRAAHAALRHLP